MRVGNNIFKIARGPNREDYKAPETIKPGAFQEFTPTDGGFTASLPAQAVVVLELERARTKLVSSAWVFNQFTPLRRLAMKNPLERGHGTQSNRFGMKDLWP